MNIYNQEEIHDLALKFSKDESYGEKEIGDLYKGFVFGFNKAVKISNNKELIETLKEAKTIIYNLSNNLEKRSEKELQAIFDKVINKTTK